jgi:hypothetical protein
VLQLRLSVLSHCRVTILSTTKMDTCNTSNMSTTSNMASMGFICQMLQRTPGTVRRAIEDLRITPTVVINTRAHYADEDVERIREHIERESK